MSKFTLTLQSGESSLSVRQIAVSESASELFHISVVACSPPRQRIDLEAIVGKEARLDVSDVIGGRSVARSWTGICNHIEVDQAAVDQADVAQASIDGAKLDSTELDQRTASASSTDANYVLSIVPKLWLLSQRSTYRIFQLQSIPDIVDTLLEHWDIPRKWLIDRSDYPKLEYCVQYGESDLAFVERLLEQAGIAYNYPGAHSGPSVLTLSDAWQDGKLRDAGALNYVGRHKGTNGAEATEFVSNVQLAIAVRSGAYTICDVDMRRPEAALLAEAPQAGALEADYEQYHYRPGAFLRLKKHASEDTPIADRRGRARHDGGYGTRQATRALEATRVDRRKVSFETNALLLWPGLAFNIAGHPHTAIGANAKFIATDYQLQATADGQWYACGEAVFADVPFRPAQLTQKPVVSGVQTATVVGPAGQDVHTDEFGRVRVQFPWDRQGRSDAESSCWLRVSHGWAGTGFGFVNLPRVGQEVLVGFLGGDPDQPIVVGRVFNQTQSVPYRLPEHKTRSTYKSCTSPGGGGFNELMFEDLAGKELVYIQAERDLRKLVKHDEIITIGHDHQRLIKHDEVLMTHGTRTEVTGGDHIERTDKNRTIVVGGKSERQVNGNELTRIAGNQRSYVAQSQHLVVGGDRRERIDGDDHLLIKGQRREHVGKDASLSVGADQHISVGGHHALSAGDEIHLAAGGSLVVEAALDLTIKGAGGFIRINPMGVTIKGHLVQINSGATQAGDGSGASPSPPKEPKIAEFQLPDPTTPQDISKTGLGQ